MDFFRLPRKGFQECARQIISQITKNAYEEGIYIPDDLHRRWS
jgi:hypothetical protein